MDLVYVGFVDICTSALSKLLCTPLFYINAESAETGNDAGLDHDLDFSFDLCFDTLSMDPPLGLHRYIEQYVYYPAVVHFSAFTVRSIILFTNAVILRINSPPSH